MSTRGVSMSTCGVSMSTCGVYVECWEVLRQGEMPEFTLSLALHLVVFEYLWCGYEYRLWVLVVCM